MSKKVTLQDLSPEQRAQLLEEAKQEEKKAITAQKQHRKAYKELVNDMVPGLFTELVEISKELSDAKLKVFNAVKDAMELKAEAYDIKSNQQSHTFSNDAATQSITIGYRVTDGWDDTAQAGIDKVNEFISSLNTENDPDKEKMVNTILKLLRKDANGNLKSSRVLELQQLAEEWDSEILTDGISIISNAYKPNKSCYFIEAYYIDGTGKRQSVPLSLSSVDFPNDATINFL